MDENNKKIILNDVNLAELLDLVGKKKTLFEDQTHNSEGELLKKAWFNHVLLTLEKLDTSVDNLQNEISNVKQQLFRDLMELREKLHNEMRSCQGGRNSNLEKVIDNINTAIKELENDNNKSVELIERAAKQIDRRVKKLEDASLVTKTKFGIFVAIGTLLSNGFIQLAVLLVKYLMAP